MLWVSSVIGSLAIAILIAVALVGHDNGTVSVEQFVSGGELASVSGTAVAGKPAPVTAFTYFDGKHGTLADLVGKPVVINFWASSCAPCLKEMPAFQRVHRELGDRVEMLGVDVSEAQAPGQKMIDRTGVTYPQARDPQGQMVKAYGGVTLPHTVVIDSKGDVVAIRNQSLSESDLKAALQPVLGR
jgi:thiol-disulfide isomerase/thioredoxin